MKSHYALLRERCGLSLREAADLHEVALDTIKAWSNGRREAPEGVIAELRDLYAKIDAAAAAMTGAETVALDDRHARKLGWPCVGAHGAAVGLAAAQTGNLIGRRR